MKDKSVEKILKLMNELGAEFDIPEEYQKEEPGEEIIYDWEEGE